METGPTLPLVPPSLCLVQTRSYLEPFGLGGSRTSPLTFLVAAQSWGLEL